MNPEEEARQEIDGLLAACGWEVQDCKHLNISAARGVAVREFPLLPGYGFTDYLLYADGKAVGVVEAKPVGHTLTGVEGQSQAYVEGLPPEVRAHRHPLPFHYESTGAETRFTSRLDPEPRSREVFAFHRPEELVRLTRLDQQLRGGLQSLPELKTDGLWPVQVEAIQNLEKSLADNRPKALIKMATGSGKTWTAASACYRLVKFAGARRILFLVDRNNLGRQAETEFRNYESPYTNLRFGEEFNLQRLRSAVITDTSRVCISTVQRLFSILRGEDLDEGIEEESWFDLNTSLVREPEPITYNPAIPIETFDVIVVDECHRSIYNQWRQVLDYFDAFIIGLTATPTAHTIGFFGQNLVMEYGHERAVADGVNVGFDVYRIRTKITEQGSKLTAEPGLYVPHRDRRTRAKRYAELDDDLTYTANQLDRDVVSASQIRTVIRIFRERLFTEIFPGRTEVPKTLIFAKTDSHADDIVQIVREEFGKGNDFCAKITYRTTGKPEELLQEFRISYNPRIVVTVDMIATGTDVKPLECLVFMRNVASAGYFEQMKGRGVRVIDPQVLVTVTPDAKGKTHFVIVDAVGVCERDKTESKPLDRQPSVSLEDLLTLAARGVATEDLASTLASRLARLNCEMSGEQRKSVADLTGGRDCGHLAGGLLRSIDPDEQGRRAAELATELSRQPTEEELTELNRDMIAEALRPFHDPRLREALLAIRSLLEQVIDEESIDEVLQAGHDVQALERAQEIVGGFRQFIEDNRDRIEALQILYSRPYRAGLRYRHIKDLAAALKISPLHTEPQQVWEAYSIVEPGGVRGVGGKQLADVVALVRHAIVPEEPLVPVAETVSHHYSQWLDEQERAGVRFTEDQRKWLEAIRDHIAASLYIERDDFDLPPLSQFGGLGRAYELFGDGLQAILDDLNARLVA